jgi:MFS transporter, DHA1 family, inner membrane transport protein
LFGVGLTSGNILGGRLGDWRLMPSVIAIFVLLIAVLSILSITIHTPWLAATTIFIWGVSAFGLVAPLQMRVVNEASGAPNLASTLNQGAFNIGNAAGAFAGELALTDGVAYGSIPWIGAAFAALGLAFSLLSHRLDGRTPRSGRDEPSISANQALTAGAISTSGGTR